MSLLPPSSAKRLPELDVLRGIAIALVLVRHLPSERPGDWSWFRPVEWLSTGGWVGVDLFFVLSGFLISGLLFTEYRRSGTINVGRFLWRRGLKIWPAYYAFFGTLLVIDVFKPWLHGQPVRMSLIPLTWGNWLFVQNYTYNHWSWTWSLAVEEHFYLLLPAVLLLLLRHRKSVAAVRVLPATLLAACLTILLVRMGSAADLPPEEWRAVFHPSHLRFDGLIFGVLLGYFYHHHRPALNRLRPHRPLVMLISIALILPPFIWPLESCKFIVSWGFTLFYCGFGGILLVTILTDWSRAPGRIKAALKPPVQVLRFLGIYSYTIYLAHDAVFPTAGPILRTMLMDHWSLPPVPTGLIMCALYLAFAVSGGFVLSHLIERPVLRWRERRFPAAQRGPAGDEQAVRSVTPQLSDLAVAPSRG